MQGGIFSTAEFKAVYALEDGGYILGGSRYVLNLGDQAWLVRTAPDPAFNSVTLLDPAFPSTIALDAPFPNPFNSSTTISYNLPKAGWTRMDVVDLNGRLVRRLVDRTAQQAGHYTVCWDASGVGAGVYFVRLESGGEARTLKMMMVK